MIYCTNCVRIPTAVLQECNLCGAGTLPRTIALQNLFGGQDGSCLAGIVFVESGQEEVCIEFTRAGRTL